MTNIKLAEINGFLKAFELINTYVNHGSNFNISPINKGDYNSILRDFYHQDSSGEFKIKTNKIENYYEEIESAIQYFFYSNLNKAKELEDIKNQYVKELYFESSKWVTKHFLKMIEELAGKSYELIKIEFLTDYPDIDGQYYIIQTLTEAFYLRLTVND